MRFLIHLAPLALVAIAAAPATARTRDDPETQLTKLTAGRTAGAPRSCISLVPSASSTTIDRTAVVYQQGSTLFVNRMGGSCHALDSSNILVTRTTTSQLCRGDAAEIVTQQPSMLAGVCIFGDFTPYTKAK